MAQELLGVGLAFPLAVASDPSSPQAGSLQLAVHEQCVAQSIWTILGTAKGERLMRPDFGCGINDLVFELNNAATAGRVASEVRDALSRYEPRIRVGAIDIARDGDGSRLAISIDYTIVATDTPNNLVYPFYLDRSQP